MCCPCHRVAVGAGWRRTPLSSNTHTQTIILARIMTTVKLGYYIVAVLSLPIVFTMICTTSLTTIDTVITSHTIIVTVITSHITIVIIRLPRYRPRHSSALRPTPWLYRGGRGSLASIIYLSSITINCTITHSQPAHRSSSSTIITSGVWPYSLPAHYNQSTSTSQAMIP